MRVHFEEIGLELLPGAIFASSFAGEAVFDWDDDELEWYCSIIRITSDSGDSAELVFVRGGHSDLYGKLFRLLESQLLRRFSDEAWFQEPIRRAVRRELGYGHFQREFI